MEIKEIDMIIMQLLVKILPQKKDVEILRNGENQIIILNVFLISLVVVKMNPDINANVEIGLIRNAQPTREVEEEMKEKEMMDIVEIMITKQTKIVEMTGNSEEREVLMKIMITNWMSMKRKNTKRLELEIV